MRAQLAVVVMLLAVVTAASPAVTISDSFDDGVIASQLWTPYAVPEAGVAATVEEDGVLKGIYGGGALCNTGINANFLLVGDFDFQIDFRLVTRERDVRVGTRLFRSQDGTTIQYDDQQDHYQFLHRYSNIYADTMLLRYPGPSNLGWTGPAEYDGRMRFLRQGNLFTAYYWRDDAWTRVADDIYFTDPAWPRFDTHNYPSFVGAFEVHWDNFYAEADDIVFVPEPASLGLLALGALRHRRRG